MKEPTARGRRLLRGKRKTMNCMAGRATSLLALLLSISCGGSATEETTRHSTPPVRDRAAALVEPKSTSARQDNLYGVTFLPAYQGEKLWSNLRDLGVGWVRLDYWIGDARYEERFKPIIERAIDEGYSVWITIYHRDPANVDAARLASSKRGGLPALDLSRYRGLVARAIQPLADRIRSRGAKPSERLVVQVENEVAPEDIAPPNPNRFWHGTSAQYFSQLVASYEAVKSVDAGIPVALAGFASEGLEWAVTPNASAGARKAATWMERMLREGKYDFADVHLYHRIASIPAKIAWVRARTSSPIAATEVAGPDERSGERYSDEANALDLEARIPAVLSAGATHVFWLGMAEAPTSDRLGKTVALTRTDASRKPAFDRYRRMISGSR